MIPFQSKDQVSVLNKGRKETLFYSFNPTMTHGVKVGLVLGEIIFFLIDYAGLSVPSNCQSEMVLVFTSKVTPTLMISRPSVS